MSRPPVINRVLKPAEALVAAGEGAWLRLGRERVARWLKDVRTQPVRLAAMAAALVGVGCAIYLSFRSTGELSTVAWMPATVGEWADQHGRLRNLPAYLLLTLPFLALFREWLPRLGAAVGVGIFGTVLELAEVFVPGRMVEWQDVTWSWAGVGAAWILGEGVRQGAVRLGNKRSCAPQS
jgi:hypothetical protein